MDINNQQPFQNVDAAAQQYYQQVTNPTLPSSSILGVDVKDSNFWKGALLGAAVTLLVTNESVQKGVVKTVSKVTAATKFGVEELKEKYEDAKAEAQAEAASAASEE